MIFYVVRGSIYPANNHSIITNKMATCMMSIVSDLHPLSRDIIITRDENFPDLPEYILDRITEKVMYKGTNQHLVINIDDIISEYLSTPDPKAVKNENI